MLQVVSLDGVEPEHWCVVGEIGADTCVAFQIPSGLRSSPPLDIHRNGKGGLLYISRIFYIF